MYNSHISDQELWLAVRNDDEYAFAVLFDRYWVRLYKTALRYLKDRENSEEAVHDVFLNIWDRRHQLDIESVPNFLLSAIRYQVYNRMRAAKPPVILELDNLEAGSFPDYNQGDFRIKNQELLQELSYYLEKLPKRCQEIFYMSRMENLSNQEIAVRLGISKRTVENQITVALKHLRSCFKQVSTMLCLYYVLFK
ncbi:RNA polymerase sigma factor [Mucilaginibacter sp. NFR10]|uniref:RNA polymerase sigma factor n=1 Tax=Mucilaginibacter sp. NFR10 TaxID=1566292 RepID=UPI0008711F32|nr:RNA polymerase sigma-70 factor [Mucilaginibacter sp. NFR10]SCW45059.1 RNA polymerase sigma-70 factor, ECF subfamily [Mucilaginibacter sp. NFR10]